ncbi:MAG: M91 family zinc metallopeptidase [Pirellula sp.]
MPKTAYKGYEKLVVDGDQSYCDRVEKCLDAIEALVDGKKLIDAICQTVHTVTIIDTELGKGNSTSRRGEGYRPLLLRAIHTGDAKLFQSELRDAVNKAMRGGITVEHIARQLTLGLSPATYNTAIENGKVVFKNQNVVRPNASWYKGFQPANIVDKTIAMNIQAILDLGDGTMPLKDMPEDWKNDLPRILRNYLTPGSGLSPTVNFNPLGEMHCADDPAMNKRPPAIGLAHELIHALHTMTGVNQGDNKTGNAKLEEIITTGFPPYNFEEFSDNKLRSQWPDFLELRQKY